LNLYRYANSNPMAMSDPHGLCPIDTVEQWWSSLQEKGQELEYWAMNYVHYNLPEIWSDLQTKLSAVGVRVLPGFAPAAVQYLKDPIPPTTGFAAALTHNHDIADAVNNPDNPQPRLGQ
jgi:hypothetical protein